MAAQWSEVERIETPESGIFVGGSLRINQRRPRRAGTSIVTEAIVRSLPPHRSVVVAPFHLNILRGACELASVTVRLPVSAVSGSGTERSESG